MTKTYGNYSDFITFTRASGGTALRRVSYGAELVTNGTFDNGTTGFTASGATLSNVSNQLVSTSTGSGFSGRAETTVSTVAGKVYYFSVDAVSASGGATYAAIRVGTSAAAQDIVAQTVIPLGTSYAVSFVAQGTTTHLSFVGQSVAGLSNTWDNISVKEVFFDQAGDPLTLFNHPANAPRIEYDSNGIRKGLLIEEARTNLKTYSDDIQTSNGYSVVNSSFAVVSISTPISGVTSATKFALNSGVNTGNSSEGWSLGATTLSNSTTYTLSVFVKPDGATIFRLRSNSSGQVFSIPFEGVVPSPTGGILAASREAYPNGWYRISFTFTTGTSAPSNRMDAWALKSDVADGVSGYYVTGAQLEAGSFPTSYIPTTGAAAIRAADIASIPTNAFGYNQKAGTVVVDFETQFGTTGYPRVWEICSASTSSNRILVYISSGNGSLVAAPISNNVVQASLTLIGSTSSPVGGKTAFAFAEDDFAAVIDAGSVLTDTSGTMTPSIPRDTLKIGGSATSANDNINGHIKSIQYYPRRLTNAQLQALTA